MNKQITSKLEQPGDMRAELRHIAKHGSTVLTGQLAVMLYAVADSVIAGRYGAEALAAMSVGTAVYASVYVALFGVMQAAMPVYAERHGAGEPLAVGAAWRQSLYLLAFVSVLGMLCLLSPHWLLRLAKVPDALQTEVLGYLQVQALAMPAALFFRAFSSLSQGIGKPAVVMWIQLASLPTKIGLSGWFVFGGLGVPAQGAVGCAWGSFVVYGLMALAGLGLLVWGSSHRAICAWQRLEPPNWRALGDLLRLGVPSGGAMLFEVTSFTLMAVLIARLGVTASGAHQVAINVAALMFMVPLSLSIAASARVSYWIGAAQALHARRVVLLSLKLAVLWGFIGTCLLVALAPFISKAYSSDTALQQLATYLLFWVAGYQLFDTLQTICVFILRSYRVTVLPFLVYAVVLWGMGLGGGLVLTYQGIGPIFGLQFAAWQSPAGFWAAATAALAFTALAFWWLLAVTLNRIKQSAQPA